jgi:hypothetical protein
MSLIRRSFAAALALTLLQSFLAAPALACTMSHHSPSAAEADSGTAERRAPGHEGHGDHGAPLSDDEQCAEHHTSGDCVALSTCMTMFAISGETGSASASAIEAGSLVGVQTSLSSRSLAPAVPPPRS